MTRVSRLREWRVGELIRGFRVCVYVYIYIVCIIHAYIYIYTYTYIYIYIYICIPGIAPVTRSSSAMALSRALRFRY